MSAAVPVRAAEPQSEAAASAIHYIISQQNADGGFTGFGTESSPGTTLDAVFALLAAGESPTPVYNKGASSVDYLESQAATYAADAGGASKLALAVALMARDPSIGLDIHDFGGVDLRSALEGYYDNATGVYGADLFDEAFYILALRALGEDVPDASWQHLRSVQLDDGSWEFAEGFGGDSNTTAMVLQAILAVGTVPDDGNVIAAVRYLLSVQGEDGGFAFFAGEESDAQSTALVIQALVAIGEDIDRGSMWERDGGTPMEALLSFQNPATGAFQYAGEDSPFATYQVVPALMLAPFPELEALGDGEPPTPTVYLCCDGPPPTRTPTPLGPGKLPDAGGGASGSGLAWLIGLLVAGGAAATAAGALGRRR